MKFLCDNCKAKYQIADEKVAGKTVRMKCRKCGHQIEVRAAITETSVSMAPPGAPGAPKVESAPPRGLATSLGTSARPKPPTPSQAPPGALAGAFHQTVDDRSVSMSVSMNEAPGALSVNDEWYVAINGVPVGPVRLSELRRKAAAGSVTEDSLAWQEGLEEWRPVRSLPELAAIVREAAQGNRPSLLAPPTPSKPPPPPRARTSQAPPTPRRPEAAPATQRLEESRPLAPAAGRSNVVPLHGGDGRRAAASADEAGPKTSPLAPAARGSAAFAPAAGVSIAPKPGIEARPSQAPPAPRPLTPAPFAVTAPLPTPDPFAVPAADPFAVPPAAPLTSSAAFAVPPAAASVASPSLAPVQPPARKGPPLWFWPVLVLTGVFGAVAAYRLIDKPQAERVIVEVPAPTATPTATAAPVETAAPTPEASASAATTAKPVAGGPRVATNTAPTATGSKTADLSGLLGGAGGPSVGGGGAGPSASGGGLDSATVQRIVRERSPGVKRACWERGGGDTKSSAKVNVSITVAANGRVQNAQATGDDPVVAKCIENQVRNWSFPAPGSETTINVPFVFVRQ